MEIGSIFEIDIKDYLNESKNEFFLPFMKNNKFNNLVLFNTGRSAIEYLFKGLAQKKDKKVDVFKYKAKSRYRKSAGHRSLITKVLVKKIV